MLTEVSKAFTLAEVLITLAIIGVVAAMTMPSLIQNYKEKVLVNQAKKSISIVQNSMLMAKSRLGVSSYGEMFESSNTNDQTANIVFKELQVVERCLSNQQGCGGTDYRITPQYRRNDGYGNVFGSSSFINYSRAVLKDGSIVGLSQTKYPSGSCQNFYTTYNKDANGNYILDADGNKTGERLVPEVDCGHIVFDVNGRKKPNQYGQDVFLIYVVPNGYIQSLGSINELLKNEKLYYEKFTAGGRF